MHPHTATILTMLRENRLLRGHSTSRDAQGREMACLLAAIVPECGRLSTSRVCPTSVMPQWFAALTPLIDDSVSAAIWPTMVRRYADLAGRWHVLSDRDWRDMYFLSLRLMVETAERFIPDRSDAVANVLKVIDAFRFGQKVEFGPQQARACLNDFTRLASDQPDFKANGCLQAIVHCLSLEHRADLESALESEQSRCFECAFAIVSDLHSSVGWPPTDNLAMAILQQIRTRIVVRETEASRDKMRKQVEYA